MIGTLTGPDMEHIVSTVHGDADWRASFDAIWDCSSVRSHVVQPDDVSPLVEAMVEDTALEGEGGRDVLVESESLSESMFSPMLVRLLRRSGEDAYVVQTMEEALAVLGVDALPPALVLEGGADVDASA
ncbi:hypothetical protein [Rubrivirga sp.]|uniref:hypothetical protein n=1 Tax=Rubrivirga sp. TaxID=1885344 RepID=UPI003C796161